MYVEIQGLLYLLVKFYAPNEESEQIKTFQNIHSHVKSIELDPDTNFIYERDWNLVSDTAIDALEKIENVNQNLFII